MCKNNKYRSKNSGGLKVEDKEIFETIEEKHKIFQDNCADKFVGKTVFTRVLWAIFVVLLGIFSTSIAWAFSTTGKLSTLEERTLQYQKDQSSILQNQKEVILNQNSILSGQKYLNEKTDLILSKIK